ncbi:hypothetical protein ACWOC1_04850 [Enterococcus quebecensis]|uniref:DUF5105 domain-containing protein n=1 Tax=Enterococcus quebecensis TaxID=903983 RepID=A0A1E5GWG2_9ENTE|nr:hypothetical protein [Enterococcus quebecensis]OEG17048.1 hypothetical protein BCR23_03300 [Enterococcus quebecensis]OJG75422.1 hypothetical protein RV12_GL001225 [Enterococcus quebecensis]
MKMKKYLLGMVVGVAVLLLAACGADPRKDFTKEVLNSKSEQYNAASFEMKINDFTYDGDERGAYVKMFANQLKDMGINGSYTVDKKEESMEMEITANVFGKKLPFQFVGKKDKYYTSTSFVSGVLDLVKSFGYPGELSKDDLNKLEGKYIDVVDTLPSAKLDKKKNPLKNKLFVNPEDAKMAKEMKKLIESFDKKSFKNEKDIVTHTFTKAEIIKMMEKIDEVSKEDKDYKKSGNEKELNDVIKTVKKDIKKMDIKVSVNKKTKATDFEISIEAVDNKKANLGMVMTISIKPQKNDKKIKIPSKKEVISEAELNEIFANIAGTNSEEKELEDDSIDYSALKDDPELQKMMDEQVNELIKKIEENPEMVTDDSANVIREKVKNIFNEEQMNKLNEAIDKALKAGTV